MSSTAHDWQSCLPLMNVFVEVVDADVGNGVAGRAEEGEDGEERQQLGHAAHQDDPGPARQIKV